MTDVPTDLRTLVAAPAVAQAILVGLVGRGIAGSRSPRMHETEAAHHGIRLIYRLLDVDTMKLPAPGFEEVLRAAEIAGFAGLNVTYPFKREALAYLDELSGSATAVRAVNTIVLKDGRRRGHNTDCWGFAESFRRNMGGAPRERVLLLGAGGAGGAVAKALLDHGTERLWVYDIDAGAAHELAARHDRRRVTVTADLGAAAHQADGLVNSTPIGMAGKPGLPLPAELIEPRHWVADIVYFPIETELLKAARERGCRTLPGSGMAVFQAARAFQLFTGLTPDADRMAAAFAAAKD